MDQFVAEIPIARNGRPSGRIHIEARVTASGACQLRCVHGCDGYYGEDSEDFFSALLNLRKQLEKHHIQVQCQGSRRDVWPSAMARQMGKGLTAYTCEIGKVAANVVSIFEPAPKFDCVTVAEQERYHRQWVESLGRLTGE